MTENEKLLDALQRIKDFAAMGISVKCYQIANEALNSNETREAALKRVRELIG